MDAEYFYCSSCGYEDTDIFVVYVRQTAEDKHYECPLCKEESSHVEAKGES